MIISIEKFKLFSNLLFGDLEIKVNWPWKPLSVSRIIRFNNEKSSQKWQYEFFMQKLCEKLPNYLVTFWAKTYLNLYPFFPSFHFIDRLSTSLFTVGFNFFWTEYGENCCIDKNNHHHMQFFFFNLIGFKLQWNDCWIRHLCQMVKTQRHEAVSIDKNKRKPLQARMPASATRGSKYLPTFYLHCRLLWSSFVLTALLGIACFEFGGILPYYLHVI